MAQPTADQTALRDRIAADAVQRALGVLRVWRDEREIGPEAARLLYEVGAALTDDNPGPSRLADEMQPAEPGPPKLPPMDPVHILGIEAQQDA
ncbi:hypothetical protein [Streptomyces prasinopilosus]|uniref:hypothetical protein n=1 Tax=Streptomyces prasinopilosus TaxID=67344 RepID=UPI0006EB93E5|nr:hypothetical protein [Streptomyces prasinopilosus]